MKKGKVKCIWLCLFFLICYCGAYGKESADTVYFPVRDGIDSLNVVIQGDKAQAKRFLSIERDSLGRRSLTTPRKVFWDKVTENRWYQMCYIPVPLIAAGFALKGEGEHFRNLRNEYIPKFRYHYDDYTQYAPAVVMVGLKAAGVPSRSSWGRMLTSDAFSTAIMALAVNSLKYTMKVERPDGSNRHSFPSGHTATAFMTATMLHKEYGGLSPWYSIGAYSVATLTGVSRQLNNKHWLSDVLVGAGIGILSTELGYYLADLIFKDKGLERQDKYYNPSLAWRNPSFLGIYMGFCLQQVNTRLSDEYVLSVKTGSRVGAEGAWFLNPYLGVGSRLTVSSMPVALVGFEDTYMEPVDVFSFYPGIYLSVPATTRWLVGTKLLGGYNLFPHRRLLGTQITMGHRGSAGLATGLSVTYVAKRNFGARIFCDYDMTRMRYDFKENALPDAAVTFVSDRNYHVFTLGASASILF